MKNKTMLTNEYQQAWDNSPLRGRHTSECHCKHAIEKVYAFDAEWQCAVTFPKFKGCMFSIPDEEKCSLA